MYNKKYRFVNTAIIGTVIASIGVFIDYNNLPSQFLMDKPSTILFASIILGSILILLFSIKYRVFKNMIYPLINHIDFFVVLGICSLTLFRGVATLNYKDVFLNIYLTKYLILVLAVFLVIRILSVGKEIKKTRKSIVDLKEILDGTVSYDQPFFIREDAVGYDLLNRKNLIQDLAESIQSYVSDERFVVGIEGAWGTGKTTFLNHLIDNISKNENFVIIDDFEPWLSESKESLLNNLLNTILVKSNLDISKREIDHFVKTISEAVLGKTYVRPIISVMENIEERRTSNIIEDINYLIDRNDKKIIFIIDNLDRLRPENIYLVLNIVNNVLNFNNLIIILAYDEQELAKGLKNINISPHYLDKIVQKKIMLPLVDSVDLSEIYFDIITQLLKKRNITYDLEEIKKFVCILSDYQVGFREFKRFINSSVLPFIFKPRKISIVDYLVIEYIHISNNNLYEKIYVNPHFFISYDQGIERSLRYLDENMFDDAINTCFEDLDIKENLFGKLLLLSFPYVGIFLGSKKNYRHSVSSHFRDPFYIKVQKNKRISSAKFFDLYFTNYSNDNATAIDFVELFIEDTKINHKNLVEDMDTLLKSNDEMQIEVLTSFSLYIDDIPTKSKFILGKLFLENYFYFGNYDAIFSLDTKNRVALVISQLIETLDKKDFENLLSVYMTHPKNLTLISDIYYWLEHSLIKNDNMEKLNYIEINKNSLIEKVLNNEFNMFERDIYVKGNSLRVLWAIEKKESADRYKKYLYECLNDNTYFRILNDFIVTSSGSKGYSYKISDRTEELIGIELLRKYNESIKPTNYKEKFLNKVLENHINGERNMFGDLAVTVSKPIDLTIID